VLPEKLATRLSILKALTLLANQLTLWRKRLFRERPSQMQSAQGRMRHDPMAPL
jgi:hypothetical protein